MKHSITGFASAVMLVAGLASAAAVADTKTLKDGVFTAAQVEAGAAVYDSSCKNCHDMKFYQNTLRQWSNQPVLYLWETVFGTMPADNPGSLMFEDYTNVLAYIFSEQGFPAGEMALNPDEGMDQITIVPTP